MVATANTLRASSTLYDLDTRHWATYTPQASHHVPACTATWMATSNPDGEIQLTRGVKNDSDLI